MKMWGKMFLKSSNNSKHSINAVNAALCPWTESMQKMSVLTKKLDFIIIYCVTHTAAISEVLFQIQAINWSVEL